MPDPESICTTCDHALSLAPATFPPDLPSTEFLRGAAQWYEFERRAWEIGESIRLVLAENRKLRGNAQVQECLLRVVVERNLRRGRQPFVSNLGFTVARSNAKYLVAFLSDPDINGQVIDALLKMRAGGFASQVEPLLHAQHAWIRNLAKKYFSRYPRSAA